MRRVAAVVATGLSAGLGAGLGACTPATGVGELERLLAVHHSATAALTQWCRLHGVADHPDIVAHRLKSEMAAPSLAIRQALEIGADEPVGYRLVHLQCGETVLSIAQNWYVPARLSAAMNRALETSDVPFGKIVAPLGYRREELDTARGEALDCPAGTVLAVRARLLRPDGLPISLVAECYTGAIATGGGG